MARIPTLIPKSVVREVRQLLSGSLGDVLWKLFVSAGFALAIYALVVSSSVYGALLASALFGTLLSEEVRAFVGDIWNRRFAEIKVPFI